MNMFFAFENNFNLVIDFLVIILAHPSFWTITGESSNWITTYNFFIFSILSLAVLIWLVSVNKFKIICWVQNDVRNSIMWVWMEVFVCLLSWGNFSIVVTNSYLLSNFICGLLSLNPNQTTSYLQYN